MIGVKVPTHREKIAMITIGECVFQCLHNLGVNHIFRVPGDYVLDLMDVLVEGPIELVCTCNELNAGYAADAYRAQSKVWVLSVSPTELGDLASLMLWSVLTLKEFPWW
jgi:TPP-dependent 2-oxoacid decarboxylase